MSIDKQGIGDAKLIDLLSVASSCDNITLAVGEFDVSVSQSLANCEMSALFNEIGILHGVHLSQVTSYNQVSGFLA